MRYVNKTIFMIVGVYFSLVQNLSPKRLAATSDVFLYGLLYDVKNVSQSNMYGYVLLESIAIEYSLGYLCTL